ncbi:MAG TPA: ATP-binding protein, partial [Desulfuromonadales bacterium]|nr:ATP-binding protein [Desulfuromonadales bacterium]
KDGSIKWLSWRVTFDKQENVAYATARDITEKKQAEETLRASRNLLHTILENVPIRVFWKDADLNYLGCNTAFACSAGLAKPEDLRGKDDFEMCWHKQAETFRNDDKRVMAGEMPKIGIEKQVITPDGQTTWIRTSKVPLYGREGKVIGLLGIDEDISEQKQKEEEKARLEAQLHQSQKIESVGRLAGGVAHDYNNMLSVIIGYAELAQMKLDSTDAIKGDLDEILTAARRSRDITRQLLAFARKQTIDPQVLDLNAAIESTLKMLRNLLGENIELVWKPREGLWPVEMDPSQLDQVLANLCINARDAIADVGTMTVETGKIHFDQAQCSGQSGLVPGDYVILTITDDGCGMTPEILEHVFEPFFTTKKVGEGTGLGLAMVYGVVKQNNGYIDVYSEPGEGTSIKIYLPRYVGQVAEESETGPENVPRGNGETVLLVEDEAGILKLATRQLKSWNYHVLAASKPGEALAVATSNPGKIDLLVTDVVMPEMNGKELADRLQLIYPQLRCLYMSGYTEDTIAHHGVLDEGIHFISKPFSGQEFAVKIRKVLDAEV